MIDCLEKPVDLRGCHLAPLEEEAARALCTDLSAMDPWLTLGYQPGTLYRYLTRQDSCLARMGVFVNGTPAGILCVRYPWLVGANLELLALRSGFQGTGLGAEVLGWLTERSRPLGSSLWTTVSSFNAGARRFYARHGFEAVACLPDLIKPGFDELLLRKRLEARSSG